MTVLRKATPEETAAWLGSGRVIFGMQCPKSIEQNSHSVTRESDSVDDYNQDRATTKIEQDSSDPVFNFETFELPFMSDPYHRNDEGEVENDRDPDHSEILEQMEASLPDSAIYLGIIEDEVSNFTSWKVEDHFYLLPIQIRPFSWAIVRITWDDNWGRYEWSGDVRCSGLLQLDDAGPLLIDALFKHWDIDVKAKKNRSYRNLLKNLR